MKKGVFQQQRNGPICECLSKSDSEDGSCSHWCGNWSWLWVRPQPCMQASGITPPLSWHTSLGRQPYSEIAAILSCQLGQYKRVKRAKNCCVTNWHRLAEAPSNRDLSSVAYSVKMPKDENYQHHRMEWNLVILACFKIKTRPLGPIGFKWLDVEGWAGGPGERWSLSSLLASSLSLPLVYNYP